MNVKKAKSMCFHTWYAVQLRALGLDVSLQIHKLNSVSLFA